MMICFCLKCSNSLRASLCAVFLGDTLTGQLVDRSDAYYYTSTRLVWLLVSVVPGPTTNGSCKIWVVRPTVHTRPQLAKWHLHFSLQLYACPALAPVALNLYSVLWFASAKKIAVILSACTVHSSSRVHLLWSIWITATIVRLTIIIIRVRSILSWALWQIICFFRHTCIM